MNGNQIEQNISDLLAAGALAIEDGNHGEYRPRRNEFTSKGTAFIRAADINNGRVLFDAASKINDSACDRIRKGIGAGGDVILSHKGTVGKMAYVPFDAPPFVCSPQTTFWRVLDEEKINRDYLYAYMRSPHFTQQLASRQNETDMAAYVSLTAQRGLAILLPGIEHQHCIGAIIGSLDDKIELNRRTNRALEEMARAIFKAWFIDFEPVKAKAEGATHFPGMPQEVFDELPDSFVDSEIGPIPEGWDSVPLYNTATFVNGAAFKKQDFCERSKGLPVIKIAELKNGISSQTQHSARMLDANRCVDTGDMLYSWSGSPETSLAVFLWMRGKGLLNQHIFKVITTSEHQKHFVYYLLKHMRGELVHIAKNKQTTGLGHVTVADMKRLHVCRPPETLLEKCDCLIAPLFDQCRANEHDSLALAGLRDTLLPKLISGELPVPTTEEPPNA